MIGDMKCLTIFTLAEAQRTQRELQMFVGAALAANIDNSRLKHVLSEAEGSLLQIIETSAFSAPLRDNNM